MSNLIAQINIGNGEYVIHAPNQLPTGGIDTIIAVIGYLIIWLLIIAIISSLFMIIFSGIQWTTSGGDEKNIEKAKGRLKYSIIGLIVSLLGFFIIQFIASFFGVSSPFSKSSSGSATSACKSTGSSCTTNSKCCSGLCESESVKTPNKKFCQ